MSRGDRPASSIAFRLASSCSAKPLLVVPLVYAVSPTPLIAAFSRSACAMCFLQRTSCLVRADVSSADDLAPAVEFAANQCSVGLGAHRAGSHADPGELLLHLVALQRRLDLRLPALVDL